MRRNNPAHHASRRVSAFAGTSGISHFRSFPCQRESSYRWLASGLLRRWSLSSGRPLRAGRWLLAMMATARREKRLFDLRSVTLRWPRKRPSKDAAEAYGPSSFEAPPEQVGGRTSGWRKQCASVMQRIPRTTCHCERERSNPAHDASRWVPAFAGTSGVSHFRSFPRQPESSDKRISSGSLRRYAPRNDGMRHTARGRKKKVPREWIQQKREASASRLSPSRSIF